MRPTFPPFCLFAACLLLPAAGMGEVPLLLLATPRSQLDQNRYADGDDLSRMLNASMIQRFNRNGYLLKVPVSTRHYYLRSIPSQYRYLRPWSRLFLYRLSKQYHARFKKKLRVTSLVRTVASQVRLAKWNGNAATAYGARRSSHLTGATLDISKHGMTVKERNWMRRVIYSLKQKGYLYAVEEFRQPTFHIMVYRNYLQYVKRLTATAVAKR